MRAMLAHDINRGPALRRKLKDPDWCAERKFDGVRTLVHIDRGTVSWRNRSDEELTKPVPEELTEALRLPGHVVIDGELVGETLFAFDLPVLGKSIITSPFHERRKALEGVAKIVDHPSLKITSPDQDKSGILREAMDRNWEGIILRDIRSQYVPGVRSNLMLKLKLTKDIDCVITDVGVDGKESANLALWDHNASDWTPIGRCSTFGKENVGVGDVVQVRYLHVSENGRIVQPRMLRKRTDKDPQACDIHQIR